MQKRTAFLLGLGLVICILCFGVSYERNQLVLAILDGLGNVGSCSSCMALLMPLKTLANIGDDALTEALVDICTGLNIQEEDVCVGAITSQGPVLANMLRGMTVSSRSSSLLCAKVFGLCPIPPVPHYAFPMPKPTRNVTEPISSGKREPIKFVHITDMHVDANYVVGSNPYCLEPICCRGAPDPLGRAAAGPFGHHKCDTPLALLDSAMEAIKEFGHDAQGILYTGDAIDHTVWLSTRPKVEEAVQRAYNSLNQVGLPVYGAIGNHDVHPVNSFPRSTSHLPHASDWALDLHHALWQSPSQLSSEAANPHATHFHKHSGSYATSHSPGLRIISVNTNYAYKSNFWLYDSDHYQPDPQGLYSWLVEQLQVAEDAAQRAWIIGHMSSGLSDYMQDQSAVFDQIVQRYRHTIAAQFYGHTHSAGFEIGYTSYAFRDESTASSISYVAPALTPESGNPAFRVYEVDPDTYSILDFVDINADMSDPTYQQKPTWRPYYSAREAYGGLLFDRPLGASEPLSPAFWHRVTEAFEDDQSAFVDFMRRRSGGAFRPKCRTSWCKRRWIEQMRAARSEYNGDALRRKKLPRAWKREEGGGVVVLSSERASAEEPHDHGHDHGQQQQQQHSGELLPSMTGCSAHAHNAANLLKSMASMRGAKELVKQSARRRSRSMTSWMRTATSVLLRR